MEPEQEMSPEEVADWLDKLDGPTPEEMCGSATLIRDGRIQRLFCKHFRTCQRCHNFRAKDWYRRLKAAMHQVPGAWQWKMYGHEEAAPERKANEHYYSFPTDKGTILVSPHIEGQPVPGDDGLKVLVKDWVLTPKGMRPSRSGCFVYHGPEKKEPTGPSYITNASLETVAATIDDLGGQTVKVEGDPDELETLGVDNVELVYELILRKKKVWVAGNRGIDPMQESDTIFDPVRAKRAVSDPA